MKWFAVLLTLGIVLLAIPSSQAQRPPLPDVVWAEAAVRARIEPLLLKQILAGPPEEHWPVIITMRESGQTPKVSPEQSPRDKGQTTTDRIELVASLRAEAERSQRGVRDFLAQEQAAGRVEAVRPFWIFNGLALRATPQTIYALAIRDDVELVRLDRYQSYISASPDTNYDPTSSQPEWGVRRVRADEVWSAFNITGTGVVVANMDTGVDYLHPALHANYRGNVGKGLYQHAGNWFDATNAGTVYPYDGYGHGTHTLGTLVGQGGIGVAPGARWIAARVLDNQGYGYASWIHAGFEWILAPNGNPALAPDVLSNSWDSPVRNSTEFQPDLARLREAGILVVFSTGNSGPDYGTVNSPASLPGVFAVGASDYDDEVAWFSGRGPSPWGEIKPYLVAPGVNVRSSTPGGAYASYNGTSMAAPHVAGVAALMLAANPHLTITATEHALTSTAVPLSTTLPNNDSGWGLVDAYAAVQAVAGAGTLTGVVMDAASRLPLPDATVTTYHYPSGRTFRLYTDAEGRYTVGLAAGVYSVTATLFGYAPAIALPTLIITGQTTRRDLSLAPLPAGVLHGVLTDAVTGTPVTATVSALGTPRSQTAYGQYDLELPAGTYTIQARGLCHRVVTATVIINANQSTSLDLGLPPAPCLLLVHSGAWYYDEYPALFQRALDELGYAYDEWRIKHLLEDVPTSSGLSKYDVVLWSSPQDSPGYIGANDVITQYLSGGGALALTGQDVAFWDGGGSVSIRAPYLHNYLKTFYIRDDAGTRAIIGQPGRFMAGLSFAIADGDGADNQRWPDEIALADADYAAPILAYQGDGSAGHAIGLCLPYRAVMLAFGYEGIADAANRREVMRRVLDYFASSRQVEGLETGMTSPQTQIAPPGNMVTFTVRVRHTGEWGTATDYTTTLLSAGWTAAITPTHFTLSPCVSTVLTIQVNIPAGLGLDVRNALTLTVQPILTPTLAQVVTMTAKTPALILVVDDDRWYNVENAYTGALDQIGVSYDVWQVAWSGTPEALNGPPVERLRWYPIVVWFTGYDWYRPLTGYDEEQLAAYLDSGGRLMLSSAFYMETRGHASAFARERLGVLTYTQGLTATWSYGSPGHPLGAGFDAVKLVNPFPGSGYFTLDDALVPAASAETGWRGDHHRAHAIACNYPGNRYVFWGIPFEALPDSTRVAALKRTLGWLGPLGQSSAEFYPSVVPAGQAATLILMVLNNLANSTAAFTATLPGGVLPEPDLPPGLIYNPLSNTLTWRKDIFAHEPLVFKIKVTPTLTLSNQSGHILFYDQATGLEFEQPLVLRVGTPDLRLSMLEMSSSRSGELTTVTVGGRNSGTDIASPAVITGLLPLSTQVIPDTIAVSGPGMASPWSGGITWRGALGVGQSVTVTYQFTAPLVTQTRWLPLEMLLWDGAGSAQEWRAWLEVHPAQIYLPLVRREA